MQQTNKLNSQTRTHTKKNAVSTYLSKYTILLLMVLLLIQSTYNTSGHLFISLTIFILHVVILLKVGMALLL